MRSFFLSVDVVMLFLFHFVFSLPETKMIRMFQKTCIVRLTLIRRDKTEIPVVKNIYLFEGLF